jgi:two-component system, OmpR family, response regulator CpxR
MKSGASRVKNCKGLAIVPIIALKRSWMPVAEQKAKRILLVDDDTNLCELMREFFAPYGYCVESAYDGRRGLACALDCPFDLVVLDVMLPVLDGFEVLRQLRKRSAVPVIMLTAKTEQESRVAGLNAGADDYLPKPFTPEELLARMRAVWRRSENRVCAEVEPLVAGSLKLDVEARMASENGRALSLTSVEIDILEFLIRASGRVVSRDELAAGVLQRELHPYDRSLDVHISHLRKKIACAASIHSVRGVGYLFTLEREARP